MGRGLSLGGLEHTKSVSPRRRGRYVASCQKPDRPSVSGRPRPPQRPKASQLARGFSDALFVRLIRTLLNSNSPMWPHRSQEARTNLVTTRGIADYRLE